MSDIDKKTKNVTIILCTYNGARFLREQLDSIVNQTYPIYELIIQDDCSTDSTESIAKEYVEKFPFIKFVKNETNKGINLNFFSAISRATGEYIAISDQDDIWELNKIEKQIDCIGDHLFCAGLTKPFSEDGSPIKFDARIPNYHLLRLLYLGPFAGHTFLFSRRLLEKLPDFSDIISARCYDAILSIVAGAFNDIVYINQVLVNQRRYITAATYTIPTDDKITLGSVIKYIFNSLKLYRELKPIIKERFKCTLRFLERIDSPEKELQDAIYMSKLQSSSSFMDLCRLSVFCIRNRDKIFYIAGNRGIIAVLRAIYFPISSSIYFRAYSKHYQK